MCRRDHPSHGFADAAIISRGNMSVGAFGHIHDNGSIVYVLCLRGVIQQEIATRLDPTVSGAHALHS